MGSDEEGRSASTQKMTLTQGKYKPEDSSCVNCMYPFPADAYSLFIHKNHTRNLIAPQIRQKTATGGISIDVTTISATCSGFRDVPRNLFAQKRSVSKSHSPTALTASCFSCSLFPKVEPPAHPRYRNNATAV